jgi:restriction system protein
MAIPDFQKIMLPLLKIAEDGQIHSTAEALDNLASAFKLSREEIDELVPSGPSKFSNRISWAKTHLKKAGLLEYPEKGNFRITKQGLDVLKSDPQEINMAYLMRFPEYQDFRKLNRTKENKEEIGNVEIELSPEETIESAYQEIRSSLADELLDYVIKSKPSFFEKLVVELLVAMGFGGTHENAARAVGKSGDDGIDGIIDEDKLGLDSIYIQAKRYQLNSKIGSHDVRDFVGALVGANANKGVFITTADFTKEAVNFISRVNSKVVLINGTRLANLMIDYGIGVTTRIKYEVKTLDTDYFSI